MYDFPQWYTAAVQKYGKPLTLQEYVGTGTPHNCDKNSWAHRKDFLVFKGEIVPVRRNLYDGSILSHIFNVDPVTHGVVEFTNFRIKDSSQWFNEYFYFGRITTSKTLRDIWDDDLPSLFGEI